MKYVLVAHNHKNNYELTLRFLDFFINHQPMDIYAGLKKLNSVETHR